MKINLNLSVQVFRAAKIQVVKKYISALHLMSFIVLHCAEKK